MNEQIVDIAIKANDQTGNEFDLNYKPLDAFLEKFAELIVKECAKLSVTSQYANIKSEYYEGFNEALIYAGNKIKDHFGVEE